MDPLCGALLLIRNCIGVL